MNTFKKYVFDGFGPWGRMKPALFPYNFLRVVVEYNKRSCIVSIQIDRASAGCTKLSSAEKATDTEEADEFGYTTSKSVLLPFFSRLVSWYSMYVMLFAQAPSIALNNLSRERSTLPYATSLTQCRRLSLSRRMCNNALQADCCVRVVSCLNVI